MWPENYPWLAVPLAAVAFFILGAVWYGMLARPWMRLARKTHDEVRKGAGKATYAIAFISSLICAGVLAYWLRVTDADGLYEHLGLGAVAAIGFITAGQAKHYAFLGHPLGLLLIDAGYDLVGFLAMSAIYAFWQG
jgi:hypothetical protein